jgi:redox-sensitive bicupin YhaK (pirin superfamily)
MMGRYELAHNKGVVEVIAGEFNAVKGPASTFTPMHVYNARLKKDARLEMNFPSSYNTGMLVVEGSATINGNIISTDHFVLFKNDGEEIEITANENAILLVLSGESINEPIVQYGPFLMNKWEELEQAIADVSAGKFGVLED